MAIQSIIGFDSAWADRNPGAICSVHNADGKIIFYPPRLCNFSQAARYVSTVLSTSTYTLLAIDQPTIVSNTSGMRPVERVAGSVLARLRTAVQPSNRNRSLFFGAAAPIWRFLDEIAFRQNPMAARSEPGGNFLIEVFPALALPSIAKETWIRGGAARYNPANRTFSKDDWDVVVNAMIRLCEPIGLEALSPHLHEYLGLNKPTKSDQDRLDSVICAVTGYLWRFAGEEACLMIGDRVNGYMVTPTIGEVRRHLLEAALKFDVPVNETWLADANHRTFEESGAVQDPPPAVAAEPERELRLMLIAIARRRQTVAYSELAADLSLPWPKPGLQDLLARLNNLGQENLKRREPLLMSLVVQRSSGLPGDGYFRWFGLQDADMTTKRSVHRAHCEAVWDHDWQD